VLEDILDRDNHAMDAVRYLIFTRFGKPVSGSGMGQTPLGII